MSAPTSTAAARAHFASGTRGWSAGIPRLSDVAVSRWSGYAWAAILATATFIALTCWWLTQDRSVPIYDAGDQLRIALSYHKLLQSGNVLGPFTQQSVYPILGHMVGALGALVGGVSVASPIIGENLVFVPLLALGCYQTGRLLFGRLAGMLAVAVVLGSPLVISLFHVFLLDAPLSATVAVAIWLVLASEDFSRVGVAGLAGLAVGVGLNVKVQFALFLVGLVAVVLLHGGWRNWRGFAVFTAVAVVVGTPWYLVHSSELGRMFALASSGPGTPPGNIPSTFSSANLLWYFWSILNSQLLLPLFALAVGGILWMLVAAVRSRGRHALRLEFLAGGFLAWLVITLTPHHDIRYGLPLIAYLAVVATGWIVCLPRVARAGALLLVIVGVSANTLGITFGVGAQAKLALSHPLPTTEQLPDRITLFSTAGFLVAAPARDGDVPGLLDALHREGVRTVAWSTSQSGGTDFSFEGLTPLAEIAGLSPVLTPSLEYSRSASTVTLIHQAVSARGESTCALLSDRTGVWVVRYDTAARKYALYCPSRHPQYYDLGVVH